MRSRRRRRAAAACSRRSSSQNEQEAARAGASWALGFTNPMAGPILVGKLGWEDVTSLRIWVRPKRLRKRARGALRQTGVGVFTDSGRV